MNIRDANIHKAVNLIRVRNGERYGWLVGGRSAPDVDQKPRIRDLNVRGRAFAIAFAQNATAEDFFLPASRSIDIGDGEKMCDAESLPRGHLIAFLFDLYTVH